MGKGRGLVKFWILSNEQKLLNRIADKYGEDCDQVWKLVEKVDSNEGSSNATLKKFQVTEVDKFFLRGNTQKLWDQVKDIVLFQGIL